MSSESNFSYTTKVNNDLLTVRGDTFDEFLANAVALGTVPAINALIGILDGSTTATPEQAAVAAVSSALGATVVSQPTDPFAGSFAPVAPPVGASAGDRTCSHGVMIKRTGQGAKGEWRGWFCPTPKGTADQCKPIFADRKNPAEWSAF